MTKFRVQNRQTIAALQRLGKTQAEIVRLTRLSRSVVRRWMERAASGQGLEDRPRTGRRSVLDLPRARTLVRRMKNRPGHSIRREAARLRGDGTPVSYSTVRRVVRNAGLRPLRQRKHPDVNPAQKMTRLQFARDHLNNDWDKVIFSDEHDIYLQAHAGKVWARSPTDVPHVPTKAHPLRVRVFGAISARGALSLEFYDHNLNAAAYTSILEKSLLPAAQELFGQDDWTFQQDAARPHTAQSTQTWLQQNVPDFFSKYEWPAKSPDLNIIENVWAWLDNKVQERHPKTLQGLRRVVQNVWDTLTPEMLSPYYQSMSARLRAVIRARGGTTRY